MPDQAKKRGLTRWLLPLLRYGLCAVAILYLYYKVDWYDKITLNDATKSQVRLIEQRGEEFLVEIDGQPKTIAAHEIHRLPGDVPDITFGIHGVVSRTDLRQALLAILLFAPVPIMAAIRLVWMLAIQNVRLGWWDAIKLTVTGNFFNFAFPGATGGDLIKAYYITLHTHHKTEAVTTIFLDRVVGLLGLMILASAMFFYAGSRIECDAAYRHTIATLLLVVWSGLTVLCVIVFSRRLRHAIRLPQLAARLPGSEHLLRIGRATVAMRQHKGLVAMSLGMAIALQLIVVFSALLMARALGLKGSFELYFVCVTIGFLIQSVPISPPQAFGVLEYAYIQFFTTGALRGVNAPSAAVAFALAVRLIQLVWALPGVLVPLLGAHMPKRSELEELERSAEAEELDDESDGDPLPIPSPVTNK